MGTHAFSMIEILVVVTIIAMVSALVAPAILGNMERAKVRAAQAETRILAQAARTYFLDAGDYANTLEDLVQRPASTRKWHGPYLEDGLPPDPWDRPYNYDKPGTEQRSFDIYSYGQDGQPGGEDFAADIGHWIR